jgi:hypothetical protein
MLQRLVTNCKLKLSLKNGLNHMMQVCMRNIIFLLFIISLFALSMVLQSHIPVHWNMLYIVEAGRRLLAGGTLIHDALDPNPPLIFYISELINFIAKKMSISSILLFKMLVYLSIVYTLFASYFLLPQKHRNDLILIISFSLLILPESAFAEREHWMMCLSLPYYFLLYQRASDTDFNPLITISITAIATIGFCLKPYFFLSVMCAELLLIYQKRDWRWVFRTEFFVILFVCIVYLILIANLSPDYYADVLPKVIQWYVSNNSPLFVLKQEAFIGFLCLAFCFILIYKFSSTEKNELHHLEKILFAITVGYALSFVLQGKGWFYHAMPLIITIFILSALFIIQYKLTRWFLIYVQSLFILLPIGMMYVQHIQCYLHTTCRYQTLVNVITTHHGANKPIFFFTTLMSESIPAIYYSASQTSSRFPFLWLLSGVMNRQQTMKTCDLKCEQEKQFIRQSINDDLKQYQPELILLDTRLNKAYLPVGFDYLMFMKQSDIFNSIWEKYHFLAAVDDYAIYGADEDISDSTSTTE